MNIETAYVGVGSNLGDRRSSIVRALRDLDRHPLVRVVASSPLIETPPEGPQDQGPYLNGAVELRTQLEPVELLELLLSIEVAQGRVRERRWGPRVIDLDLLLYGQRVIDQPDLKVPHPRMHQRWFVLEPLCTIAPAAIHPGLGVTIECLRDRMTLGVTR